MNSNLMAELRALLREKLPAHRAKLSSVAARCTGKFGYSTAAEARAGIRSRYANEVEVYHCPHCSLFHIGSSDSARAKRKMRKHYLSRIAMEQDA